MINIKKLNNGVKNIKITKEIKRKESANDRKLNETRKNDENNDEFEKVIQFKSELAWCKIYLDEQFKKAKTDRQKESLAKAFKILNSEKSSFISKRQTMSQYCGNYRKMMADEICCSLNTFNGRIQNMSKLLKTMDKNTDCDNDNDNNKLVRYKFIKKCNNNKLPINSSILGESSMDFKLNFA